MKALRWSAPVSLRGRRLRLEKTNSGWHVRSADGVALTLRGIGDGFACRIQPGPDADVVQLGMGDSTSGLCDALYVPSEDLALRFEGGAVRLRIEGKGAGRRLAVSCGGPLTVTRYVDYLRVHRGLRWFRPMDRNRFATPPAGWCSWYYYYLGINETEMARNTDWLAEHLKPFGCEWVQLDDGWQGEGTGYGLNRDFRRVCEAKFPGGMRKVARHIRSRGMRAGIWCIPFYQSDPELEKKLPGVYVRNEDGSSPGERSQPDYMPWMQPEHERYVDWSGRYVIDPTSAGGREYIEELGRRLCREWGYDYVKIDAQGGMPGMYRNVRTRLSDPSVSGDRAYREALAAFRKGMGSGRFLLNCGGGWDSVRLCDGIRIGGDVQANWHGVMEARNCTLRWLWLNTLAFYTDPDVVCVRPPLSRDQAETWALLVGITGQLLMASDKMYELGEDRIEILRRVFPVADIHPMDLYPQPAEAAPSVFDLKVAKPRVGAWDVVALFNWSEKDGKTVDVTPAKLGLGEGPWLVADARAGIVVSRGDGRVSMKLAPASSALLVWHRLEDRPQFIGTNRHITQGAVDVDVVRWDARTRTLSGTSRVVGGDEYRLRIAVPPGWSVVTKGVPVDRGVAVLTLRTSVNRIVRWAVSFRRRAE
jgi:hypothetical protein